MKTLFAFTASALLFVGIAQAEARVIRQVPSAEEIQSAPKLPTDYKGWTVADKRKMKFNDIPYVITVYAKLDGQGSYTELVAEFAPKRKIGVRFIQWVTVTELSPNRTPLRGLSRIYVLNDETGNYDYAEEHELDLQE